MHSAEWCPRRQREQTTCDRDLTGCLRLRPRAAQASGLGRRRGSAVQASYEATIAAMTAMRSRTSRAGAVSSVVPACSEQGEHVGFRRLRHDGCVLRRAQAARSRSQCIAFESEQQESVRLKLDAGPSGRVLVASSLSRSTVANRPLRHRQCWLTCKQRPKEVEVSATKKCTRCSKRRKVEKFHKDKHQQDGLSSWCKGCTREYDKAYLARKKAEVKA